MPIDLSGGPNIAAGWGRAPELSAPNIGELVKSILANRLARDKMTQESIADTIKNVQAQRQGSAYAEALRNAGLTQGQDISGLDSAHATALARLIAEQTPDTQMDAYHKALADYYNRSPGAGMGGSGGGARPRRPMTQGQEFNALKTQEKILGGQADELAQQQEDYGLKPDVKPATHGYVMRNGKLDYARTPEEQANPALVSPGDPLTDPNAPTFTPDVYKQRQEQSTLRQKILNQQKGVQSRMLGPSISQNDVNQVNQADGTTTQDQTGGGGQATTGRIRPDASTGAPVNTEPNKPVTPGEQIDLATVHQYILKANGDRDAARQMARADGWSF